MSNFSRRKLITTGLAATAGASGLAVAARLADRYGLIPPDCGGVYGPGNTLTYASHRLLTRHSLAREFSPHQISKAPFAKLRPFQNEAFRRMQDGGFVDWQVEVDGMVARPSSFSLAELRSFPSRSQITQLACEEGWSFIAEWTGVALSHVLSLVETAPASPLRGLLFDPAQLVGQYRHGRCLASPDASGLRNERRRASRGSWWSASSAPSSSTRLQKREVCHPPHHHG